MREKAFLSKNFAKRFLSGVQSNYLTARQARSDLRLAHAAICAHGFRPGFEFSSTDANIPMSLGIPAIKIGSGGTGGRGHSLEEWIDVAPDPSIRGMAAGLTTVLAVAGIA